MGGGGVRERGRGGGGGGGGKGGGGGWGGGGEQGVCLLAKNCSQSRNLNHYIQHPPIPSSSSNH